MQALRGLAFRSRRLASIAPGLVVALGVIAYRRLLPDRLLLRSPSLESWFFQPTELPTLLVLGVSGWLLWRRRERLRSLPTRSAPLTASLLAALGTALFVWASFTRAADLLLLSLSLSLLSFAASTRGRPGSRVVLLPALALLLGIRIPAPLRHEIVWHLQLGAAVGATWLLQALGQPFLREGVMIHGSAHSFQVIDACSGLRGIEILFLVALLVRELFATSGWRSWLPLLVAPGLGYALNLVRIAYVAASPDPEALAGAEGDHTPQGVAVLVAGTGILYALGWAMERRRPAGRVAESQPPERVRRTGPWLLAAAWLGVLVVLSLVLSPFETGSTVLPPIHFPAAGAGWTSEPLENDPLFVGPLPEGQALHRRYERGNGAGKEVVELFVGFEAAGVPNTSRILSSRLWRPGPDWLVERSRPTRVWELDRDARLTVASHGPGTPSAVVLNWKLRDAGLWWESWRSLLALDASPARRSGRRAVVQLVAYAPHDGQLVLDRAKQRLDRFVADFREDLAAL